MTKPNLNFKLDKTDIAIIEAALRERMGNTTDYEEKEKINLLLAKIHDQKNWYRPKGVYVSG
tara:strand:+ start:897 stop:1082 length:186 start_codon:yes stop_codon:yes gene_type:complete